MTNDLEEPTDQWTELPARSIMWVDSKWEVHVEPFDGFGEDS